MNQQSELSTVAASALLRASSEIFCAIGVPEADSRLIAVSLVEADRRGTHSHGVMRLPLYIRAVQTGGIVPDAPMRWTRGHGATAVLDAADGFGQVAMAHAVDKARDLVREHATALVAVRGSSHYGAGAYWASQLAREGLMALLASTTGASVTPFGGAEKLLGTNPLTIAFPTGGDDPVVLDMATSAGAYGRIVEAGKEGHEIPEGWAVDADGVPTTDPTAALAGALLPFGGHKGSGLATLLELLAGPLAGGRMAAETTDMWADPSVPMGTGHLLWVVDPAGVHGNAAAVSRAAAFQQRLRDVTPARAVREVLSPGDVEHRNAARNADRVPLPASVLNDLAAMAEQMGTHDPRSADES
ncbi:L-2-hydroxycarboxylate dehydrogenase (NAD+) [Spinactinospora alkalitolerans]|uniref:L-2-hydroxycarboxylate dehydrogenase (NAD+) n=1 Tax=Spinactinospora alkalitolerans TaxID=687207 RepID=A0A852TXJ1_9ACTN|nr:Ldh family oxidoreductase [Spinactinospora alkalitolerans]NYE48471.1 L-2-hydroxycarboxylate dehydrogenase (NAD+) [Spinactinospora alkalitolerans]